MKVYLAKQERRWNGNAKPSSKKLFLEIRTHQCHFDLKLHVGSFARIELRNFPQQNNWSQSYKSNLVVIKKVLEQSQIPLPLVISCQIVTKILYVVRTKPIEKTYLLKISLFHAKRFIGLAPGLLTLGMRRFIENCRDEKSTESNHRVTTVMKMKCKICQSFFI